MSASSSPTSSTVAAPVRSRAARCSSRRRYAAASAAVGSRPAATGPSRPPGPAPAGRRGPRRRRASSAGRAVRPSSGRVMAPRSSSASSGCRARWSARPALTPSTAVSRSRKSSSARSAARRASGSDPLGRPAGGTEQPGQAGHGQVGIGRGGDRGDQRVGPQLGRPHAEVGEQQAFGPRRIRESHPRQPPCQRGPRATHPVKLTDNGRVPLRRVSHRSRDAQRTLNAAPWRVYSDLQPSHGSRA